METLVKGAAISIAIIINQKTMAIKTYKLSTIKEIMDAVNSQNVEYFLKDFTNFLRLSIDIRKTYGDKVKQEDYIIWIDDKKSDFAINVKLCRK